MYIYINYIYIQYIIYKKNHVLIKLMFLYKSNYKKVSVLPIQITSIVQRFEHWPFVREKPVSL